MTLNFAFKIKDISAAQIQKKIEENPKGKDPEIFGLAIILISEKFIFIKIKVKSEKNDQKCAQTPIVF